MTEAISVTEPEQTLSSVGLSRNEIKVYLALLELGISAVGKIADRTKLHRRNVYDSLDNLMEKGLATYIVKKKIKHFEAANPEVLRELLKEKENQLMNILPTLMLNHNLSTRSDVQVQEGLVSARMALKAFLRHKQPIYTIGTPKQAPELMGPFIEQFHKERIKLKIPMFHIYNSDAPERIAYLNSLPYTEAQVVPQKFNSPMAISVCADETCIKIWNKNALTIHIKNQEIAESFRDYFKLLRLMAKEPSKT